MRDFLDAILEFIDSESLTDEEYAGQASLGLTQAYTVAVYRFLKSVLEAREEVSTQLDRLKAYFEAKGTSITTSAKTPKSQIFLGGAVDGYTPSFPDGTEDESSGGGGSSDAITSLTGEVEAEGPGEAAATLSNAAVIAKVLTGFAAAAGTVSATDSIKAAFQKVVGNVTNLLTSLTAAEADIDTLQTNVTTLSDDLDTLEGAVTAVEGSVSTLQGAVTTLDTRLDTAETDINTTEGNVTTLQGNVTTLQGNVSTINTTLSTLAPKDSPTFTTQAIFNWATATTLAMFDASKKLVSIVAGSNGQILRLVSGVPTWSDQDSQYDAGNSGSSKTIDWSNAPAQLLSMTASCTLTFSNPKSGAAYVLRVLQGGSGSYTITWPATVRWPSDTAPTLTTTVGDGDLINFFWDGTNYYGSIAKGYNP